MEIFVMSLKTKNKLKVDLRPAEALTIEQCHAKAGKDSFTVMKIVEYSYSKVDVVYPVHTVLNIYYNEEFKLYMDSPTSRIIIITGIPVWMLLS